MIEPPAVVPGVSVFGFLCLVLSFALVGGLSVVPGGGTCSRIWREHATWGGCVTWKRVLVDWRRM